MGNYETILNRLWFVFLRDCFDYFEEKEQQRMRVEAGREIRSFLK